MTTGSRKAVVLVGLVGVLFSSLVATRVLAESEWDVTRFAAFGAEATTTREYGEATLGKDIYLRRGQGHDGKFFYVQANDPWILSPESHAEVLDRPFYRSQRMLYPVLAGAGGLAPPAVIIWLLLVVNVAAMGFGSAVVGRLAQIMGSSPWLGLAFALNPGFISEMTIDGAGVVAGALMFAGVVAILEERFVVAPILFTAAALSREVFLVSVVGVAVWLWTKGERKRVASVLGAPFFGVGIWALYLRLRIDTGSRLTEFIEFDWPGLGAAGALPTWLGDPISLIFGVVIVLVLGLFLVRVLRQRELVGYSTLGFAVLGVFLSEPVWINYFDLSRALAPVITAYVLLTFSRTRPNRADRRE